VNDIIQAMLTAIPQTANDIAERVEKPAPAVRKVLKRLREDGTIAFAKVKGILHYTRKARAFKRTRDEMLALVSARAECHRAEMEAATSPRERRVWKKRIKRAENRALALA
jgi:DNA-binding Lrp family transcriptional regulator